MSSPKKREPKSAICVTCGEQSENHHGMAMQGDGLAARGFSVGRLRQVGSAFEAMGGVAELIDMKEMAALTAEECEGVENAAVLVLRDGVDILLGNVCRAKIGELQPGEGWSDAECAAIASVMAEKACAKAMMKELTSFEWDKTYWDVRRGKELNKRARWNVCFGEGGQKADMELRKGTIVAYSDVPLLAAWKAEMQRLCGEEHWEAEGNYYYDIRKCYIGYHGDAERKKVVAASLCTEGEVRELNWNWFRDSKPFGKRIRLQLRSGDCYIMSEKATGYDWRKTVKIVEKGGEKVRVRLATLRHAAAVPGSKHLKIRGVD